MRERQKTERIQFLASARELERLDKWMFENEIHGRSEALRCLILNRCGPDVMLFGRPPGESLDENIKNMRAEIQMNLDKGKSIWVDYHRIDNLLKSSEKKEDDRFHEADEFVRDTKLELKCETVKFGVSVHETTGLPTNKGIIFFRRLE